LSSEAFRLLYNGRDNKEGSGNKDQETVWMLFETDLYFSLSSNKNYSN
jgi:hypothetical protein